ncbi:hypothetical protein GCM10023201_56800 [Actinomycetospora corticicola]|uniref:Transcriptional regulator, AbiEi antitoxin, Type IV TA system n=1 Tax=Actinomycetospora corticicola TaxID=663602 RepID=A0A7Y9DZY9_9PSEU|nr:hypothetical protein [Actinomycetospora corticicola]
MRVELLELAAEQDQLLTREQMLRHGMTDEMIEANVAARRWVPVFHGVYALTTGELTPHARRRAALLFVRGAATLSHSSAGALWNFPGCTDEGPVHVTVPYTSSARGCEGVVVHRSRAYRYIVADADPPVTTKVRTLVDLAAEACSPREAMRILTAGAAARRVDAAELLRELTDRPPRRYGKVLLAAANLLVDGVESTLEADFSTDVLAAHGLPTGVRQVPRIVEGRRRIEDHEWELPRGTLTARLDGWRFHANRRTAHADRQRDNAAELEGRARLTFGTEEVGDACRTAALLARRMVQLGWEGELTRCAACE